MGLIGLDERFERSNLSPFLDENLIEPPRLRREDIKASSSSHTSRSCSKNGDSFRQVFVDGIFDVSCGSKLTKGCRDKLTLQNCYALFYLVKNLLVSPGKLGCTSNKIKPPTSECMFCRTAFEIDRELLIMKYRFFQCLE